MKALIVVGVQDDSLPGGCRSGPASDRVATVADEAMELFDLVVAVRDPRPADLRARSTPGAELALGLNADRIDKVFHMETDRGVDNHSGCASNSRQTAAEIGDYLRARGVDEVHVLGPAADCRVKITALDVAALGFATCFIIDGCRGVQLSTDDVETAVREMRAAGVKIRSLADGLETEVVWEGRYLRMVRRGDWEYAQRTNAATTVGIVAVTDDGKLVLVEQDRKPLDQRVVELPAGLVGDVPGREDESPEEAATEELRVETGYQADEMTWLFDGVVSGGLTDETVTLIRARGLTKVGPGGGDEREDITVHEIPVAELGAWLQGWRAAGAGVDLRVYAALPFCK